LHIAPALAVDEGELDEHNCKSSSIVHLIQRRRKMKARLRAIKGWKGLVLRWMALHAGR
jgi:hypothetical protein